MVDLCWEWTSSVHCDYSCSPAMAAVILLLALIGISFQRQLISIHWMSLWTNWSLDSSGSWHHSTWCSFALTRVCIGFEQAESFQSPPTTPTPGAGGTQGQALPSVPASSSGSSSAAQSGAVSITAQASSNLSRINKKKRKRVNLMRVFPFFTK